MMLLSLQLVLLWRAIFPLRTVTLKGSILLWSSYAGIQSRCLILSSAMGSTSLRRIRTSLSLVVATLGMTVLGPLSVRVRNRSRILNLCPSRPRDELATIRGLNGQEFIASTTVTQKSSSIWERILENFVSCQKNLSMTVLVR